MRSRPRWKEFAWHLQGRYCNRRMWKRRHLRRCWCLPQGWHQPRLQAGLMHCCGCVHTEVDLRWSWQVQDPGDRRLRPIPVRNRRLPEVLREERRLQHLDELLQDLEWDRRDLYRKESQRNLGYSGLRVHLRDRSRRCLLRSGLHGLPSLLGGTIDVGPGRTLFERCRGPSRPQRLHRLGHDLRPRRQVRWRRLVPLLACGRVFLR
jgi:hypothetical protein